MIHFCDVIVADIITGKVTAQHSIVQEKSSGCEVSALIDKENQRGSGSGSRQYRVIEIPSGSNKAQSSECGLPRDYLLIITSRSERNETEKAQHSGSGKTQPSGSERTKEAKLRPSGSGSNKTKETKPSGSGSNKTKETKPSGSGSNKTKEAKPCGSGSNKTKETKPSGSGSNKTKEARPSGSGSNKTKETKPSGSGSNKTKETKPSGLGSNKTKKTKPSGSDKKEPSGTKETKVYITVLSEPDNEGMITALVQWKNGRKIKSRPVREYPTSPAVHVDDEITALCAIQTPQITKRVNATLNKQLRKEGVIDLTPPPVKNVSWSSELEKVKLYDRAIINGSDLTTPSAVRWLNVTYEVYEGLKQEGPQRKPLLKPSCWYSYMRECSCLMLYERDQAIRQETLGEAIEERLRSLGRWKLRRRKTTPLWLEFQRECIRIKIDVVRAIAGFIRPRHRAIADNKPTLSAA